MTECEKTITKRELSEEPYYSFLSHSICDAVLDLPADISFVVGGDEFLATKADITSEAHKKNDNLPPSDLESHQTELNNTEVANDGTNTPVELSVSGGNECDRKKYQQQLTKETPIIINPSPTVELDLTIAKLPDSLCGSLEQNHDGVYGEIHAPKKNDTDSTIHRKRRRLLTPLFAFGSFDSKPGKLNPDEGSKGKPGKEEKKFGILKRVYSRRRSSKVISSSETDLSPMTADTNETGNTSLVIVNPGPEEVKHSKGYEKPPISNEATNQDGDCDGHSAENADGNAGVAEIALGDDLAQSETVIISKKPINTTAENVAESLLENDNIGNIDSSTPLLHAKTKTELHFFTGKRSAKSKKNARKKLRKEMRKAQARERRRKLVSRTTEKPDLTESQPRSNDASLDKAKESNIVPVEKIEVTHEIPTERPIEPTEKKLPCSKECDCGPEVKCSHTPSATTKAVHDSDSPEERNTIPPALSSMAVETLEFDGRPPLPPRPKRLFLKKETVPAASENAEAETWAPSPVRFVTLLAWFNESFNHRSFGFRVRKLESLFRVNPVDSDDNGPAEDQAFLPCTAQQKTADLFSNSENGPNDCPSPADSAFLPIGNELGRRLSPFIDLARSDTNKWSLKMSQLRKKFTKAIKSCFTLSKTQVHYSMLHSSEV